MTPSAIARFPTWIKKIVPSLLGGSIVAFLEKQPLELMKHAIYGWVVEHIEESIGEWGSDMIAFVASYLPAILTAVLIYFVTAVMLGRDKGTDKKEAPEPLEGDLLQFVFGVGQNYDIKKASGLYKTTHTFVVGIKNASARQFLSNCKLWLDIPDQAGGSPKSYALVDAFTLIASEEKHVPIVSYDEPATISGYRGDFISLHIPIGAGYGGGVKWPWRLPVGAYVFTLRASSKEDGAREAVCKVWVDESGRLHFEKA
jgi:hypothetical protein